MAKGGSTKEKAAANGKKVGRPSKPKIEQHATSGIASCVLSQDGPPVHVRSCDCLTCSAKSKLCECNPKAELFILCRYCRIREEHAVCRCEECGWWDVLTSSDKRLRFEGRRYLTDRRDGKPAQGVFVGDTRESARELDFGDLPELIASGESQPAGKPN